MPKWFGEEGQHSARTWDGEATSDQRGRRQVCDHVKASVGGNSQNAIAVKYHHAAIHPEHTFRALQLQNTSSILLQLTSSQVVHFWTHTTKDTHHITFDTENTMMARISDIQTRIAITKGNGSELTESHLLLATRNNSTTITTFSIQATLHRIKINDEWW